MKRASLATVVEPLLLVGLGLALAAGIADALGGSIALARRIGPRELTALIGLSAGFILAVTLLERLPAAQEESGELGLLLVFGGFLTLFIAENLFSAHAHEHHAHDGHAHHEPDHLHPHGQPHDALVGHLHPETPIISPAAGVAAYAGLGIHAFFDGAAIVSGFLLDVKLGIVLFLAVILHKIPEGLSMASITLASGRSRAKAFQRAIVLGILTFGGGLVAGIVGDTVGTAGISAFLALATGGFLYVAASDLIPAANASRSRRTIAFVLGGVALFLASEWLLETAGFSL